MALKSSFKNMLVCLTLICLVCSSLLAAVYAVTKQPIEDAAAKKLKEAIAEVLPEFESASAEKTVEFEGRSFSYYEVYDAEGYVLGYAVNSSEGGFGGPVSLMVGVLADGTVYNTKVLSHSETPGLGAKCTEAFFHDQFMGFNPAEKTLAVKQDKGDIDAITAATITSRAYTKAVAKAVAVTEAIIAAPGEETAPAAETEETINEGGNTNE